MLIHKYGGITMSRPRKMTTEQMITVVDSYYLTRAECNEKRLKCSLIAAYAVELGYRAEGYDFARNMEVREHIERMKCYAEVQAENQMYEKIVSAYKSLDVAGFIRNNSGHIQLAKALSELDAYWKRVYEHSEMAAVQNRKLMEEKSGFETALKESVVFQEKLKSENAEFSTKNNKLIAENRYLRKMLRTYLYPAIANEILIKENALRETDTQATEAAAMDMMEFSAPQSLRESVASDIEFQSEEDRLLAKMWELCDE
jgi:hypothetical protein